LLVFERRRGDAPPFLIVLRLRSMMMDEVVPLAPPLRDRPSEL